MQLELDMADVGAIIAGKELVKGTQKNKQYRTPQGIQRASLFLTLMRRIPH